MAASPRDTTIAGGIVVVMVIVFVIAIVGIAYLRAMQGGV
jgi:preprotein translocase subunit SecE